MTVLNVFVVQVVQTGRGEYSLEILEVEDKELHEELTRYWVSVEDDRRPKRGETELNVTEMKIGGKVQRTFAFATNPKDCFDPTTGKDKPRRIGVL